MFACTRRYDHRYDHCRSSQVRSLCFDAVKEATKTHPRETAPGTSYHCQCANQRREREVDGLSSGKPHVVSRIWPRVTEHTRSSNTHQKHIPVVHTSDTDAYWFTLLCTWGRDRGTEREREREGERKKKEVEGIETHKSLEFIQRTVTIMHTTWCFTFWFRPNFLFYRQLYWVRVYNQDNDNDVVVDEYVELAERPLRRWKHRDARARAYVRRENNYGAWRIWEG